MPWGECESLRSSHYLCAAMTCREKSVNFSEQVEKKTQTNSFMLLFYEGGISLVIGAVLPSGQNIWTPKAKKGGKRKPIPFCFFERITPEPQTKDMNQLIGSPRKPLTRHTITHQPGHEVKSSTDCKLTNKHLNTRQKRQRGGGAVMLLGRS